MSDETTPKEQEAPKESQGPMMRLLAEQPMMLLMVLLLGGGSGSVLTNLTDKNEGLSTTDIAAVRQVVEEALNNRDRLSTAQMETRDLTLRNMCEGLIQSHVKEYHKE